MKPLCLNGRCCLDNVVFFHVVVVVVVVVVAGRPSVRLSRVHLQGSSRVILRFQSAMIFG